MNVPPTEAEQQCTAEHARQTNFKHEHNTHKSELQPTESFEQLPAAQSLSPELQPSMQPQPSIANKNHPHKPPQGQVLTRSLSRWRACVLGEKREGEKGGGRWILGDGFFAAAMGMLRYADANTITQQKADAYAVFVLCSHPHNCDRQRFW